MSILRRVSAAPVLAAVTGAAALTTAMAAASAAPQPSFIGNLHKISTVASTVPAIGDVNPSGWP